MDDVRILIVEDDAQLRSALATGLREEGYVTDESGDGDDGAYQACVSEYDLIVLDVTLPGRDGFSVCHELREAGVKAGVLMLTARDAVEDRINGLDAGADDYLTKPFSLREFLARVRAMLRRARITLDESKPDLIKVGRFELDTQARAVRIEEKLTDLTPREYELLLMLARHPGRTFTRDYLLERIWGTGFEGSDRVVDTTVVRLRRKLGEEGERVVSVWGVGYRFDAD